MEEPIQNKEEGDVQLRVLSQVPRPPLPAVDDLPVFVDLSDSDLKESSVYTSDEDTMTTY